MSGPAKQAYRVRLELPDGKGILTEPVCVLCGEGDGNGILCPLCDRRFCSAPCFGVHLKAVDDERDLAPLPEPVAAAVPPIASLYPLSDDEIAAAKAKLAPVLAEITNGPLPPIQNGVRHLDRKGFATWSIRRLRRLPQAERDARIAAWFGILVENMPDPIRQKMYATAGETTLEGTITGFQKAPEHWYTLLAGLGIDPDCSVCSEDAESVDIAVCEACGWEDEERRCDRCAGKKDRIGVTTADALKLHRALCMGKAT